jgi:hypothetical protein
MADLQLPAGAVRVNPALDLGDSLVVAEDEHNHSDYAAYNDCDNRDEYRP